MDFQVYIAGKKKSRVELCATFEEAVDVAQKSRRAGNRASIFESVGPDFPGGPDVYAKCTREIN